MATTPRLHSITFPQLEIDGTCTYWDKRNGRQKHKKKEANFKDKSNFFKSINFKSNKNGKVLTKNS